MKQIDKENPGHLTSQFFMPYTRFVFLVISLLSSLAQSADLNWTCQGKTRFIHRGAESTYPVDEQRRYHMLNQTLETTQCSMTESGWYCYGLTEQQATRRIRLDTTSLTVSDTLELPTSALIFEGRCQ